MFDIFLAFLGGLGCRGWADADDGSSWAPSISGVLFVVSGSSLALVGHFFHVFGGLQGACFGLTIRISVG